MSPKHCEGCGDLLPTGQEEMIPCPRCGRVHHIPDSVLCKNCGRVNNKNADFCADCGSALVKFCKNCNGKRPGTASFCSTCGSGLDVYTTKIQRKLSSGSSPDRPKIGWGAIVLVFLLPGPGITYVICRYALRWPTWLSAFFAAAVWLACLLTYVFVLGTAANMGSSPAF